MHCTEYVDNMPSKKIHVSNDKQNHFRYNHMAHTLTQHAIRNHKKEVTLPRFSSFYHVRQAAQTHQISFKADSRNVRHAEKFYTAGVIRVHVFLQSTADYRHS